MSNKNSISILMVNALVKLNDQIIKEHGENAHLEDVDFYNEKGIFQRGEDRGMLTLSDMNSFNVLIETEECRTTIYYKVIDGGYSYWRYDDDGWKLSDYFKVIRESKRYLEDK